LFSVYECGVKTYNQEIMSYSAIFETSAQNQIILLKNIFEQNNVRHRIFDEAAINYFVLRVRIEVMTK
jgi:hypothetical protein